MIKKKTRQFVPAEMHAEQLARTNRSAAALIEKVGASHAMQLMELFAGQTIRFPRASTIIKSGIVVFIRKGLFGTYKGRKERRAALKETQETLLEMGTYLTKQHIERIFKAKRWVQ